MQSVLTVGSSTFPPSPVVGALSLSPKLDISPRKRNCHGGALAEPSGEIPESTHPQDLPPSPAQSPASPQAPTSLRPYGALGSGPGVTRPGQFPFKLRFRTQGRTLCS